MAQFNAHRLDGTDFADTIFGDLGNARGHQISLLSGLQNIETPGPVPLVHAVTTVSFIRSGS
jgi:hypothetical protein